MVFIKILVVDDEYLIRNVIKEYCQSEGYKVDEASNGEEAIDKVYENEYDLIIMDIMMPDMDGYEASKEIKEIKDIPIIMLSARTEEEDKLNGFNIGIDDYVTKPFGMMALVSRIKAVLRRYEKSDSKKEVLEAGGITIDENQHTVFAGSQQIFLTVKEFDLLALLIKNRGNVLTREQLLESIWEVSTDVESRTVDVHIRTLRAKLGEYEKNIETIRGVGYKLT